MEQLRRWREPAAMVLLIAAGIRLLAGIVAVPVLADEGYDSFAIAALFQAGRTFDVVLLLGTACVAASCLLTPATPRARAIITFALIETAAAVLVSIAYGVIGLSADTTGRGIETVYLLLGLVVPVLAVIGLFALLRVAAPAPVAPPVLAPPLPPVVEPPPALPAAWQPEQATGRVWNTAGDAARGAPGAGWPAESPGAGWYPIPGPADQQQPVQQPDQRP